MIENFKKIIILSIVLSLLFVIPVSFAAEDNVDLADNNLMANDISNINIDEDIISDSLSEDNNLNAIENNDIVSGNEQTRQSNEIYFSSDALNDDGNGSIDNPYKTLSDDRIKPNSILHFSSGIYNYTPINSSNNVNSTVANDDNGTDVKNASKSAKSASPKHYDDWQKDYETGLYDEDGNPIYRSVMSTSGGQYDPGIYETYWSANGPINETRIG